MKEPSNFFKQKITKHFINVMKSALCNFVNLNKKRSIKSVVNAIQIPKNAMKEFSA